MSGNAIPNLYLKWRAFRELVGVNRSDAVIAEKFFGHGEGPIKFSKLLRGDYGCANDIAAYVAEVMNEAIAGRRKRAGLATVPNATIRGADLSSPLYEFMRKVIDATEAIDEETLDRAHDAILQEMTLPAARLDQQTRLRVEQYGKARMFAGFEPSGGSGPVVFKPGLHTGRLAVEGLTQRPAAAYVLITRNPAPLEKRLWDLDWSETVMWLPSPFEPVMEGRDCLLMTEPQPVSNVIGRFTVTAALLLDPVLAESLDPRPAPRQSKALDEPETARFLTNLRRLTDVRRNAKHDRKGIVVASNVYIVEPPSPARN